jgi:hypothetical protein
MQQQQQPAAAANLQPSQQQPAVTPIPTKPLDSAASVVPTTGTGATTGGVAAAAGAAAIQPVAGAAVVSHAGTDPLHDSSEMAAKETAQLAALSKVVQQQQDTISRQVSCCRAGARALASLKMCLCRRWILHVVTAAVDAEEGRALVSIVILKTSSRQQLILQQTPSQQLSLVCMAVLVLCCRPRR